MNENKSTVIPSSHVVEIEYGKFRLKLYNPRSIAFSVVIRKAKKEDKIR
jgi:hypothetical protein